MDSIDTQYFRERARAERQLADAAASASAADAHRQMADAYEALIRRFDEQPGRPRPAPASPSLQA